MDTQVLMNKLLKAVSYQFKDDKTSPGITVSSLKHGYYASVVRYEGSFAKGKVVVCKAKGDTLEDVLQNVAEAFLKQVHVPQNPVEELSSVVSGPLSPKRTSSSKKSYLPKVDLGAEDNSFPDFDYDYSDGAL